VNDEKTDKGRDLSYTMGRLTFTPETGQVVFEAMAANPGLPVVDLGDVRTFPAVASIVRELAERGPFYGEARMGGWGCHTCLFNFDDGVDAEAMFKDPANHEPSCLWRRARALYPDV
jgi:hypothetical protein